MATYQRNLKINIDLEADTGKALTELSTELSKIKGAAEGVGQDLEGIQQEIDDFNNRDIEAQNIEIGGEVDIEGVAQSVKRAKDIAQDQADLQGNVKVPITADVKEFDSFDLEGAEDTARAYDEIIEKSDLIQEAKEGVSDENNDLHEANKQTTNSLTEEVRQIQNNSEGLDELQIAKQAAADANRDLDDANKLTTKSLKEEHGFSQEMAEALDTVTRSMDDTTTSSNSANRALRRIRRSTDETTDSMRAAAQVGELFEDGLGSLSVNLGAFTVAIRNFLTQVPLLLTGLGALGAAATGAASSVVGLGGALAGVMGAGVIARAKEMNEQFSQLEGLGESLQVIMMNVRDVLLEAAEPLIQNSQVIGFFRDGVQALAFTVSALASGINQLTESSGSAASQMFSISDAISLISEEVAPAMLNVIDEILDSFVILGEEIITALGDAMQAFANAIEFSTKFFDQIDDVGDLASQFSDTLAELAVVGARVGGGLIPVFSAFSSIMKNVADALNELPPGIVENVVTFIALAAAINKVSGLAGSFVTIVPNLVIGLSNVAASASSASGAMATLRAATFASGEQLGGFLNQISAIGGISSLSNAVSSVGTRIRQVAFSTEMAEDRFDKLSEEVEQSADELQRLAANSKLAETVLDDVDDHDFDIDADENVNPKQFVKQTPISELLFGGAMFGGGASEAAEEATEEVSEVATRMHPNTGEFKVIPDDPGVGKLESLRRSISRVKRSFVSTGEEAVGFIGSLFRMQAAALKTAGSILTTAASILYQGFATAISNKSLTAGIKKMYTMAAANFSLSTSANIATISMLGLASSIAVATGGIALLVGIIGGLAVGIITNFDKIKSGASGTFGFLKQVFTEVADVLANYFLTAWNLMVDAFEALLVGVQPLISMFMRIGEMLGLVSDEGSGTSSIMSAIAAGADIANAAINALAKIFKVVIDIIGAGLFIFTNFIRFALQPTLFVVEKLISGVGMLVDALLGLFNMSRGGFITMLQEAFNGLMETVEELPDMIESGLNFVIKMINSFLSDIESTLGINIGQSIDQVDFDSQSVAKSTRAELSAGTSDAKDFIASKVGNTINMEEKTENNVNQTVNADPEDKEAIKRTVKDAMEEADSFTRRRNGFTGN